MNDIELNAILYYADYLSLQHTSQPVTDNCKYFFIHGAPINSLYILDMKPEYDEDNQYYKQALVEYNIIRDKFGEEGVSSFIDDICSIKACGSVDADRMLKCIHQYSNKYDRKQAFNAYKDWKKNKIYTRTTIDENGKRIETQCTPYTYHVERMLARPQMEESIRNYSTQRKNNTSESLL